MEPAKSRPSPSGNTLPVTSKGGHSTLSAFRVFFSIWIALAHSFHSFAVTDATALWIKQTSFIATDAFIVMSAVSLWLRYSGSIPLSRTAWARFMLRRLARIWPTHALLLIAMAIVTPFGMTPGLMVNTTSWAWAWLCQFVLIQAWGVNSDWSLWNSPSWTLSALVICYALYPLVSRLTARINRPRTVFAGAAAVYAVAWVVADNLNLLGYGGLLALPQQIGAIRAAPIFVLSVLAVPLLRPVLQVPRSAALELLAKNSYCIYIVHWPILKALELLRFQGWIYALLSIVVIFVAGHYLRTMIDDPIQNVLRKRLR